MAETRKSLYAEPEEGSGDPTDAALVKAARLIHGASGGELEIDENAPVSRGDDPGAYVQAWVWVPFCNVEEG
jgi:hypothetical protein